MASSIFLGWRGVVWALAEIQAADPFWQSEDQRLVVYQTDLCM